MARAVNTVFYRVQRDLKDLQESYGYGSANPPIHAVPVDERADHIHALVVGPQDTPYAHGFFLFDIRFSADYPNEPPKVRLLSTDGGKTRFNPNLYADGKVCLSILGTWRGEEGETWRSSYSLGYVLQCIQCIIMNSEPYYNEPGFEKENLKKTPREMYAAYGQMPRHWFGFSLNFLPDPNKGNGDKVVAAVTAQEGGEDQQQAAVATNDDNDNASHSSPQQEQQHTLLSAAMAALTATNNNIEIVDDEAQQQPQQGEVEEEEENEMFTAGESNFNGSPLTQNVSPVPKSALQPLSATVASTTTAASIFIGSPLNAGSGHANYPGFGVSPTSEVDGPGSGAGGYATPLHGTGDDSFAPLSAGPNSHKGDQPFMLPSCSSAPQSQQGSPQSEQVFEGSDFDDEVKHQLAKAEEESAKHKQQQMLQQDHLHNKTAPPSLKPKVAKQKLVPISSQQQQNTNSTTRLLSGLEFNLKLMQRKVRQVSNNYTLKIQHETIRHAVCDVLESLLFGPRGNSSTNSHGAVASASASPARGFAGASAGSVASSPPGTQVDSNTSQLEHHHQSPPQQSSQQQQPQPQGSTDYASPEQGSSPAPSSPAQNNLSLQYSTAASKPLPALLPFEHEIKRQFLLHYEQYLSVCKCPKFLNDETECGMLPLKKEGGEDDEDATNKTTSAAASPNEIALQRSFLSEKKLIYGDGTVPFDRVPFEPEHNMAMGTFKYGQLAERLHTIRQALDEETARWIQQGALLTQRVAYCASVLKDEADLLIEGVPGVSGGPVDGDANAFLWNLSFMIPEGVFEESCYTVELVFHEDSTVPPRVRFLQEIFHPNVSPSGIPFYFFNEARLPQGKRHTPRVVAEGIMKLLAETPNQAPSAWVNQEAAQLCFSSDKARQREYRQRAKSVARKTVDY